jgi:osmoprotectant transport system permease protein
VSALADDVYSDCRPLRRKLDTPYIIAALLACLAFAGCNNEPTIRIGSKNFTEGLILGEIVTGLSNAKDVKATHRSALGGTQILFQALKQGDIDAYADYTGTIALEILGNIDANDEEAIRAALEKQGVGMSGQLGFNNTYALGMLEESAKKLSISKISDLAKPENAKLRLGFSEEFLSRKDGWPGLKSRYKLPHSPKGSDHSINYTGLMTGSVDATDLYSTDPEIRIYNLRLLEDDLEYFPHYECVILYRLDLHQRSPEFVKVVESLQGSINNEAMLELNTKVRGSNGRVSEELAATEFLNAKFGLKREAKQAPWYHDLLIHTGEHLRLVAESLSLAVLIAIPLGIAARYWPRVGHAILGIVGVLQTLPSMAILVLMVPLLGLGPRPAIVALFFYSLLPIVRNTYTGLTGIPGNLKESAEVLGLTPLARLWLVELPLASPSILAGVKTAAVINVGTATIGALVAAGGYGTPILSGLRLNNWVLLMQGAIPAALMAVLVQFAFDGLERLVVPKGLRLK